MADSKGAVLIKNIEIMSLSNKNLDSTNLSGLVYTVVASARGKKNKDFRVVSNLDDHSSMYLVIDMESKQSWGYEFSEEGKKASVEKYNSL